MKNKLMLFIVIVLSLFFINNVSAKELFIDYDHEKMQLLDEHIDFIDELINFIDTNNSFNYPYVISFHYKDDSSLTGANETEFKNLDLFQKRISDYSISIGLTGYTNDYFGFSPRFSSSSPTYVYYDISLLGNNKQLLSSNSNFKPYNIEFPFSLFENDEYKQALFDNLKRYLQKGFSGSLGYGGYDYQYKPTLDSIDNNKINLLNQTKFTMMIYSSLPVKFYQYSSSFNDTLTINDKTYNYDDDILTYYDYKYSKPKTPTATFELTDTDTFTNSNQEKFVMEKKVTINFNEFDMSKYIYKYAIDDTENFITISHTVNKKFSFKTRKNCVVYVKIIDKATGTDVFNGSLNILGISKPVPVPSLVLLEEKHYDDNENMPVMYKFYSLHFDYFNTDMYEYQYYDNYIDIPNVVEENDHRVAFFDNYSLPVWIFDKETSDLVASYEFYVNDIVSQDYPIAFFEVVPLEISCENGTKTYTYKKEVYIHFSRILVDEFSYQYQFSYEDKWHDESELTDYHEFFIELYRNTTIRVRILDKATGAIVHTNTLNINGIEENASIDKCLSDLDDYFDYMNNITSQNGEDSNGRFFANLLSIAYNTAPNHLRFLFRMFLILTFVSIVFVLLLR